MFLAVGGTILRLETQGWFKENYSDKSIDYLKKAV